MGPSEIICPFCKNTGRHLCPDVSEPVEIDCSHKQCPVMLQKEIDRLKSILTPHENWVSKSLEGLETRVNQLTKENAILRSANPHLIESHLQQELERFRFALNRLRNQVGWARQQTELRSAMNCLDTGIMQVGDILNGKTPVPEDRDDLKV